MQFSSVLTFLKRFTKTGSYYLEQVGLVGLVVMFIVNLIDVVGAKLFLWPLRGAIEVIAFAQVLAIAPAIAFGLILGRHIQVDFFLLMLSKRKQAIIDGIISLISCALFAILMWQSIVYGQSLAASGEVGSTSRIPFFPFAYLIAFCCIPVCLFFLVEVLDSFVKAGKE
jgi:TRAP-type C4-dicarboxylate transport system permease small subunit